MNVVTSWRSRISSQRSLESISHTANSSVNNLEQGRHSQKSAGSSIYYRNWLSSWLLRTSRFARACVVGGKCQWAKVEILKSRLCSLIWYRADLWEFLRVVGGKHLKTELHILKSQLVNHFTMSNKHYAGFWEFLQVPCPLLSRCLSQEKSQKWAV